MGKTHFIAFDLGATSGRCILGSLSEQGLELKELSRFPNRILHIGDRFFWNIFSLYEHILDGLKASSKENVHITSIGIDTWGVDIAFIGRDGDIIGLPRSYRDPYTENIPEDFFSRVMPEDRLYGATGIQIMDFNTLFQLYAMKQEKSPALEAAERILFMPDVLSYMLTGQKVTEYTIASTSGFVNPYTKEIDRDILEKAGIAPELFGEITMPGKSIGILKDEIAAECGLEKGISVIAVAGHDTGSAVAAVPATDKGFAYLSSGTWSLMGIETCRPVINEETYRLNITNEGGVDGTIRLLKNITGMWILENCMKEWEREGRRWSYSQIMEMAGKTPSFRSLIDPDDRCFATPGNMTAAIREYCGNTSQPIPETDAEIVCCIFESLALKYKDVLSRLRKFSDNEITALHIIGGGSRNDVLNQYTADATGKKVIAGPSEATAIGNIMMQARAAGLCGSLAEMRRLTAESIRTRTFLPSRTEIWDKAYRQFTETITGDRS